METRSTSRALQRAEATNQNRKDDDDDEDDEEDNAGERTNATPTVRKAAKRSRREVAQALLLTRWLDDCCRRQGIDADLGFTFVTDNDLSLLSSDGHERLRSETERRAAEYDAAPEPYHSCIQAALRYVECTESRGCGGAGGSRCGNDESLRGGLGRSLAVVWESEAERFGVVATKTLRAGSKVAEVCGEVMTLAKAHTFGREASDHITELINEVVILSSRKGSITRLINYARPSEGEKANVRASVWLCGDHLRVFLMATKHIQPDDVLLQ